MTFEEIEKIIDGMLSVQKELQESQLKMQETQAQMQETQTRMQEQSKRQQLLIDRLIGYSLTNESDHLDLEEKFRALDARIKKLENNN